MRTLIVSNRLDPFNGNLGDYTTDPSLYFPWLRNAKRVQLDRLGVKVIPSPSLRNANVVLGGGGLLETTLPLFKWGIERILEEANPERTVVWGAGLNSHNIQGQTVVPDYLQRLKLVGIRDYLPGQCRWTPSVDVMRYELDGFYRVLNKAVVFDNWQFRWKVEHSLPQMDNNLRAASAARKQWAVRQVLEFLGSAETVLTSSYHGVLWATLMGKKVVVTRPFSSKFQNFRHQPTILQEGENWRDAVARATAYPGVLGEYRQATQEFAEEVRNLFSL